MFHLCDFLAVTFYFLGPQKEYLSTKCLAALAGLYLQTVKQLISGKSYAQRGLEIAAQAAFFIWQGSSHLIESVPHVS